MLSAWALGLSAMACTGAQHEGTTKLQAASAKVADENAPPSSRAGGAREASMPERSLSALGEQGSTLAPGMRKLEDGELSGARDVAHDLMAPVDKDTCVRVAWSANAAVDAKMLDASGRTLAEVRSARDGSLGERGPICARRGDTVRVQFAPIATAIADGGAPGNVVVRFVAWGSP